MKLFRQIVVRSCLSATRTSLDRYISPLSEIRRGADRVRDYTQKKKNDQFSYIFFNDPRNAIYSYDLIYQNE